MLDDVLDQPAVLRAQRAAGRADDAGGDALESKPSGCAREEALLGFAGCAVVISHDRWFLDRIATHILAFYGDSHVEWFVGNYQDYEKDRKRRLGDDAGTPHRLKYRKFDA